MNDPGLTIFFFFFLTQATIARGSEAGPCKITDTMAFMFESCLIPRICPWALESPFMDRDYYQCWIGLRSHFSYEEADNESDGELTMWDMEQRILCA